MTMKGTTIWRLTGRRARIGPVAAMAATAMLAAGVTFDAGANPGTARLPTSRLPA